MAEQKMKVEKELGIFTNAGAGEGGEGDLRRRQVECLGGLLSAAELAERRFELPRLVGRGEDLIGPQPEREADGRDRAED